MLLWQKQMLQSQHIMDVNPDAFDALRASTIKREVAVDGDHASGLGTLISRGTDAHNAVVINALG